MLIKFSIVVLTLISSFLLIKPQIEEHNIEYKITQSDSTPIILYEKLDSNKNTIWYKADIETEVCRERLCEIAHITFYWDEIGDFLKFTLPNGKDLTKYDHNPFNTDDYKKLTNILADSISLLKEISYNEINDIIERAQKEVDAVTGATPGELANAVVKDAAFSTYTFWHIVYGAARDTIINQLELKTNADFVLNRLKNGKPNVKLWAIDKAKNKYKNNSQIKQEILSLFADSNFNVSSKALHFYTDGELEDKIFQQEVVSIFPQVNGIMKFELLYRLKKLKKIYPETFSMLLNEFLSNKVGISAYTHIIEIATLVENPNQEDLLALEELLNHHNFYVARKAYDYLKEQSINNKSLSKDLKKFEKKYKERLN